LVLTVESAAAATTNYRRNHCVGIVVVDSNVKKVQHLTGGIVGELLFREGDRVRTETRWCGSTKRSCALASRSSPRASTRCGRASPACGERDGVERIVVPPELIDVPPSPELASALDSERKLFDLRRTAREARVAAASADRAARR